MRPSRLLLRRYSALLAQQQGAEARCRPLGPTLDLRNLSASSSAPAPIQPRPSGRSRPTSIKSTSVEQSKPRPDTARRPIQRGKTQPKWSESLVSATPPSTLSETVERTSQQQHHHQHPSKATTDHQQQQRDCGNPSEALHTVRELLLRSRPYEKAQFEAAHQVLDSWKNPRLKLSPACVNSAIDLLERLVQEVAAAQNNNKNISPAARNNHHRRRHRAAALDYRFMVEPRYYNPVINQWKETAKRCHGKGVVSPQDLWERLQNLARQSPAAANAFEYNIMTLTSIMNVMIAIEPDPAHAPIVAEAFFEEIRKHAKQLPSCEPSLWTYATLLKAWAESGRPDASDRMDAVMEHMNEHAPHLEPNEPVYHIWLRFWAERGDCIDKMEACVQQLQQDGVVQLSMQTWSQMVYGYAQARDLEKAAQMLERMVEQHNPDNEMNVRLLAESVQHVVMACRHAMDNKAIPNRMRNDLLAATRKVMQQYARAELLGMTHLKKLQGNMMEVYARSGDLDEVERLFAQIDSLDNIKYSILIGAYSKNNRPEKASELLHKLLKKPNRKLDFQTFVVAVIDAWSESDHPDAFAHGESIFRMIDSETGRNIGVKHSAVTFGVMLKCLARLHKSEDSGRRAEALLDEMEKRNLKPNGICYTLAIKACYNAEDMVRAENLMTRFQNSDTPPTIRTFSEILMYFAMIGTLKAAERCDLILKHIKSISGKRPELKPDKVFYSCVMTAWNNANVPESADRMSDLFDAMMAEGIEPDYVSCNQLLSTLAKSDKRKHILRADEIMVKLEKSSNAEIPNSLHYTEVTKGLVRINDPDKATRLLIRRVESYLRGKKHVFYRLPQSLDMVVQMWLEANDLHQATALLKKMQELYESGKLPEGPDRRSFHPLLERWRKSQLADKRRHMDYLESKIKELFGD